MRSLSNHYIEGACAAAALGTVQDGNAAVAAAVRARDGFASTTGTVKRVRQELGHKSPNVILRGADLRKASLPEHGQ